MFIKFEHSLNSEVGIINIDYEEIQLPFESLEEDYISGEELSEAVESSIKSLDDYSIEGEGETVRAYKGSKIRYLFSVTSRPYIEFEISESQKYSHITAEIVAYDEEKKESILKDVQIAEVYIEQFFCG